MRALNVLKLLNGVNPFAKLKAGLQSLAAKAEKKVLNFAAIKLAAAA